MERATRFVVITSLVVAGVTHAWLAVWQPWLGAAAAAALVSTFLLARVSLGATLAPVFATMYVAPALLFATFGASDYHLTLVWLAALAGPLLAHSELRRWHLPRMWAIPVVGWGLVVALTWPVIAAREIDFSLVAARTYDTRTALFEAPPVIAAAWVVIVAIGQLLGILWIDLLFAKFRGGELKRLERAVLLPAMGSAAVGAVAGLYQALVDVHWMNPEIWANLERSSGLMLDANTFGMSCAMWAPMAVVVVWRGVLPTWTAVILYVLLGAAMWTADSRTALLTFGVGTAGVVVAIAQRMKVWQPRMAPILVLLGAAVLVLAMFVAPRGGTSKTPLEKVFDRLPRLEATDMERFADEMWTRFGYGRAASRMFVEHPLTGVGVGAFHVLVPDYERSWLGTLAPDNAQNWWRHQIAELGLIGAIPAIWLSVIVLAMVWRGGPYVEPFGTTTVLRMVLAGVGLSSLLGVPTQHPSTWLSFATLAFMLYALYESRRGDARRDLPSDRTLAWAAAFAIALVTLAGQAVTARGDLRVPLRALRAGTTFRYGFTPPEGLSQFGPLRWAARRAVEVMPIEQPWLELGVWPPNGNLAAKPITMRVLVNGRQAIEHEFRSAEPANYFIQMPQEQWVMLELSTLNATDSTRALHVAYQWRAEVPPHILADRVIRQGSGARNR